jgi:FHA domain-containing protein
MPFSVKIQYRGSAISQPEAFKTVSRPQITIGRASDCDIVLDDPKRHVSRVHATIVSRDGGYVLTVVSKVNNVLVNGRQFAPNTSTPVRSGDRIEIGQYALEVLSSSADALSRTPTVKLDTRNGMEAPPAQALPPRGKGLIETLAEEDATVVTPRAATGPEAQATPGPGSEDLLRAFMEGAGIMEQKLPRDAERFMRESGAVLRAAVEGIVGFLMAGAETKKTIGARDLAVTEMNDDKSSQLLAEVQKVLGSLVDPPAKDSALLPARALQDACSEMRLHELALVAGMRAAVLSAIERFDPSRIEELVRQSRGNVLLNKKGALWNAFLAHQGKLARETADDFNRVFAKEFAGAYTAEVRRLRKER